MAYTILVKRGNATGLPGLDIGELAWVKDDKIIYIGDSTGNFAINRNLDYISVHENLKNYYTTLPNLTLDHSRAQAGKRVMTSDESITITNHQAGRSYVLEISGDYTLTMPQYSKNIGTDSYGGGTDTYIIVFYVISATNIIYTVNIKAT